MHSIFQMAAGARIAAEPHAVNYVDFLTVTLTAVCAILAALAIIIAIAAIWGYAGIKKGITKAVTEKAVNAIESKLNEYPDSKSMIALFESMQSLHAEQKRLSSQLVSSQSTKSVARTSKKVQDDAKDTGSLAQDYPGKGK